MLRFICLFLILGFAGMASMLAESACAQSGGASETSDSDLQADGMMGSMPTEVEEQIAEEKPAFTADFEQADDKNFDGWPDGWDRQRGKGFPIFADVKIVKTANSPSGKHALRLQLDGGSIQVNSPEVPLHGQFSYMYEVWLRTERLSQTAAKLSLCVKNASGEVCGELSSPWLQQNDGWKLIRLGPITPKDMGQLTGIFSLCVTPQTEPGDLEGAVWIDKLQIRRLPRMSLSLGSDHHLFMFPDKPKLVCEASGIQDAHPEVEMQLLDALDNEVARERFLFTAQNNHAREAPGFVGTTTWSLPIERPGFYRVKARMSGNSSDWLTREVTLVVMEPILPLPGGEFGWSLPKAEKPLPVGPLSQVLLQSGISHVRFPVWFSPSDPTHGDRLAWFAERLSMHDIDMVGVLDQPPDEIRAAFREKGELPAASIFADSKMWGPAVDPVMTRLSLKVHRWQLGGDRDQSFMGLPELPEKVEEIRSGLNRLGQNLKVSLNWSWLQAARNPSESAPPWSAITYSADPSLTADELRNYLEIPRQEFDPERWVELQPLPADQYTLQARTRDLVERIVAAKQGNANVIFCGQPFDNERGLMRVDGTPGELFLPWRTSTSVLAGTKYVGPFELAGRSENHVFACNGKAVMVLWNDKPTTEYFDAEQEAYGIDAWGRRFELVRSVPGSDKDSADGKKVQVEAGPWPTFIVGMNEHLARWRIDGHFVSRRLESIFGREQKLVFKVKNPFPQALAGEMTIRAPETWEYPKQPFRFRVAEGEELELPIPVQLTLDASGGGQTVQLDFDLSADERYHLGITRTIYVGLEEVSIETQTRLQADKSMILELSVLNHSKSPISFNFVLFPPGRRRETNQLVDLPPGRTSTRFVLPDAEELVGKRIYLRAEEIGGPRVVNQSLIAEH